MALYVVVMACLAVGAFSLCRAIRNCSRPTPPPEGRVKDLADRVDPPNPSGFGSVDKVDQWPKCADCKTPLVRVTYCPRCSGEWPYRG
jgi:hypothetical protein